MSSKSQRLIRMHQVLERIGLGKAWVYKLIAQRKFPQPIKIGSRSIAFLESEIDDWIDQRIAESRGEVA